MNLKISIAQDHKEKDNLIIIADKSDLDWIDSLLTVEESQTVSHAIKHDISQVVFPHPERVVVVHFFKEEKSENETLEAARVLGNSLLVIVKQYKLEKITLLNVCHHNHILQIAEGMALGNYQFLKYQREAEKKQSPLKQIKIFKDNASREEVAELSSIVEATYIARDLVNEPPNILTAQHLADEAARLGEKYGFDVTVFDEKKIKKLKMGGLLAVNQGSTEPPRFVVMEHKPSATTNAAPIVLVGKGVTFDTGGLSLKPTPRSMDYMKCDMAGAATVIGVLVAASALKLPLHIIGLVPSTDNRLSKDSYSPNDVITMYSGHTCEIMNTDAEGRLILADALHYAKEYKPELVMDFATLTGSAAFAIGKEGICYMGNADVSVKEKIVKSGLAMHERLVEFPLWKEYGDQIKSEIADIKNLGGDSAGMITAGKFLEFFTNYDWLHFDIAGPAYLHAPDAYRTREGTGVGVRLVTDFLIKY